MSLDGLAGVPGGLVLRAAAAQDPGLAALWPQDTDSRLEVQMAAAGGLMSKPGKLRILAEYDEAATPCQRGAMLRREGLYHSHLIEWRKAGDAGTLVARSLAEQPEAGQRTENEAAARRRRRAAPTCRTGRVGAAAAAEREAGQEPGSDPGRVGDHGKDQWEKSHGKGRVAGKRPWRLLRFVCYSLGEPQRVSAAA